MASRTESYLKTMHELDKKIAKYFTNGIVLNKKVRPLARQIVKRWDECFPGYKKLRGEVSVVRAARRGGMPSYDEAVQVRNRFIHEQMEKSTNKNECAFYLSLRWKTLLPGYPVLTKEAIRAVWSREKKRRKKAGEWNTS